MGLYDSIPDVIMFEYVQMLLVLFQYHSHSENSQIKPDDFSYKRGGISTVFKVGIDIINQVNGLLKN